MAYYLIDFENVKSRGMEGVELLAEEDVVCIFYSDNADSMTFDLHRKLNETRAQIIYHKVAVGTKNALDFQLATYLGYLICEQQREGVHPDYYIVTKDNGFTSLMVYWKAQGVPVRIVRNLLWGKNSGAAITETAVMEAADITDITEPENAPDGLVMDETIEETEPEAQILPENGTQEEPGTPAAVLEPEEGKDAAATPEDTAEVSAEPVKKTGKKSSSRKTTPKKTDRKTAVPEPDELTREVEKVLTDQTIVPQVVKFIRQYKTKQGINNALNKEFKDSKRTSEIYSAIKPLIADKKGK